MSRSGPIGCRYPSSIARSTSSHRGNAFLNHPHRLQSEQTPEAAGDEAGRVVDNDGLLPELLNDLNGAITRLAARRASDDNFHQCHGWDGIEEMHSQEAIFAREVLSKLSDRDAACVCDQEFGLESLCLVQDGPLQRHDLGYCFNDQRRPCPDVFEVRTG